MAGNVEVSIVVWRDILLNSFEELEVMENEVIKGPLFVTFHQVFYKHFVISVF